MKARAVLVALLLLLPLALFAGGQSEAQKTVVLYTAHEQEIIDGMIPMFEQATGIKAQVVKLGSAEVVARVRAVLRRAQGEPAPQRVLQIGVLLLDLDVHRAEVNGQEVKLTPTEFSLLQALAEHPGHALTRQELIEGGLGYSYEALERTVDSHIKNLRRKLATAGAPEDLVETVFGIGYRLVAGAQT